MLRHTHQHSQPKAALAKESGGCLWFASISFGMALPPLAVIVLGLLMTLVLLQIDISVISPHGNSLAPGYTNEIAPLFTPEVQRWGDEIVTWSALYGLDPNLVATVMQIESCGDPRARSYAGAMGLFQVMPFHFDADEDPYKPATNASRGLAYLKSALDSRGGNVRLALAGYNGGIMGAKRPESVWPAEMLRYVYWGTGIYTDAKQGQSESGRLNEWLGKGGASLCAQAAGRFGY